MAHRRHHLPCCRGRWRHLGHPRPQQQPHRRPTCGRKHPTSKHHNRTCKFNCPNDHRTRQPDIGSGYTCRVPSFTTSRSPGSTHKPGSRAVKQPSRSHTQSAPTGTHRHITHTTHPNFARCHTKTSSAKTNQRKPQNLRDQRVHASHPRRS